MTENKGNSFNKTHFAKNIKSLFNKESKNFYSKHRLNLKLKSLISKEKSLNDRKIIDFNYGEMFHFFKVGMKKFDDDQIKRKNFYKTLYEENRRFNKEYQKNYSLNTEITPKQTKPNIKSKTFQKFYDKHQITDTSRQRNNLFNRDPLLVSNHDIKLFYMIKEFSENQDEYEDEALDYVNKLENNLNQKSIINKMKMAIYKQAKGKKSKLNKDKDFPLIDNSSDQNVKTLKNTILPKKYFRQYSIDLRKYNHKMKQMIANLYKNNNDYGRNKKYSFEKHNTDHNNHRKSSHNRNQNIFNDMDNENQKTNYYSCSSNSKKVGPSFDLNFDKIKTEKERNKSSNQIESLYNELFKIKKNISKNEKKNENEIRYLYTIFGNNSGKIFKQSFLENQKLIKLDQELVYSVNSFND